MEEEVVALGLGFLMLFSVSFTMIVQKFFSKKK